MSTLQEMRQLGIDPSRRNARARPLADDERKALEPFLDNIHYSQRYSDDEYEYRHVLLPKQMLKLIPDQYLDQSKKTLKLLWEDEWRSMGITQSLGWEHYEVHEPEPHILLFNSAARSAPSQYHFVVSNKSYYQISPKAIVSDACASYSTLERLNERVFPAVTDLTKTTDFFSHYRVNLFHKTCPFWNDDDGMCGNIACAVQTLENEEDIPKIWRASELGKLEGPKAQHPGKLTQKQLPQNPLRGGLGANVGESCVVEYDDECDERDYCVHEDESAGSKGDYVSLVQNPERFTGYAGQGAQQVWQAIYRENCFQKSSFPHSAQLGSGPPAKGPAALDFRTVLEAAGRQHALEQQRQQMPSTPFVAMTGLEVEDECIEKRVFYRLMSGMHASISTHLCWDFLNQTTGEWTPNVECYANRLQKFPERISNLYFNYAVVTRAIAKLGPHLSSYTFCSGEPEQDQATRAKVLAVTDKAASVPQIFDESLMFKNGEGPSLKEDFRNRFRNVSRLMDCVGCDKCRLWGKVQTAGYGTALKVLFEYDNDGKVPPLERTELVALFNTYARISSSLNAIQKFRIMAANDETIVAAASAIADEPVQSISDRVRKPHHVIVPERSDSTAAGEDEEVYDESHYPSIGECIGEELDNVLKAFKFLFERYIAFPQMMWHIISTELLRLWQFFIGLPVRPRSWAFERPSVDEL
ncbi:oxidoreductin [Grosmannia clavigera kw1407]|uniref:Cyclin-dependent kinases regulatory subunit n=1 Tax=Grosmannia clavigera (strain kw1407 / UAMH 11150) TaxID=655863 RepID=F0XCG6_GROCL|nr:oxidoreductin [Grosmannia clavigera kw1407]EFX03595.1 oxidoreductin [Grosmannia clavigera kw1407]